jgi:TonB family protein
MRKLPFVVLFSAICFWPSTFAQRTYTPPEVTSAGDAYTPYNVVFDGLFVLDIGLSDEGEIQRIEALRDPGAMLGAAKNSVRTWKFQPRASRLTVAFVYRPANDGNAGAVPPKDFAPVIPPARSDDGSDDYVPVGILTFAYPDYPVNSVIWGSVVVQATVDSAGDVKDVTLLHALANFDSFAQEALKQWRFRAATVHGKPVPSKIVIAFIFQSPHTSN